MSKPLLPNPPLPNPDRRDARCTVTPLRTGASTCFTKPSRYAMISSRFMKPWGSSPRYSQPGSLHCQFGVTRQKVSQRWVRQVCTGERFSSTR